MPEARCCPGAVGIHTVQLLGRIPGYWPEGGTAEAAEPEAPAGNQAALGCHPP